MDITNYLRWAQNHMPREWTKYSKGFVTHVTILDTLTQKIEAAIYCRHEHNGDTHRIKVWRSDDTCMETAISGEFDRVMKVLYWLAVILLRKAQS
jgi:hypothetical protein